MIEKYTSRPCMCSNTPDKCMGRGSAWPIHVDGGSAFRI
jgi:hypothetical protein